MNTALNAKITIASLTSAYAKHGYAMFQNDVKNYNLNIFGVRSKILDTNTFNDIVGVAWKYNSTWLLHTYAATTDPGLYYFEHPMTVHGTHVMAEGQYRGAYTIDKHQNKYDALCQIGPMDFYEDKNRDKKFDRTNLTKGEVIGANIHSVINKATDDLLHESYQKVESTVVHNWSAACQVIANPTLYQQFMSFCYEAKKIYGNKFTYTLFEEDSFNQ